MSNQRRLSANKQKILKQTMQSIAVRFVLNLPKDQKMQKVRLAYHYKKAYYYYIDEVMKQLFPKDDPKKVDEKWFYQKLSQVTEQFGINVDVPQLMKIMSKNKPTCGAIILNERENKVVVIQSAGKYGFPKGGKNEGDTAEECAAREVREEVGLIIGHKINSNDKVSFIGRGEVPVTYFIIRKFDENQPFKIDPNQIDRAFWMNTSDVSKCLSRFVEKSRIAWRQFEEKLRVLPKITMDEFLNAYRDKSGKQKQKIVNQCIQNPFLNFSFDRQKLSAVFNDQMLQVYD